MLHLPRRSHQPGGRSIPLSALLATPEKRGLPCATFNLCLARLSPSTKIGACLSRFVTGAPPCTSARGASSACSRSSRLACSCRSNSIGSLYLHDDVVLCTVVHEPDRLPVKRLSVDTHARAALNVVAQAHDDDVQAPAVAIVDAVLVPLARNARL